MQGKKKKRQCKLYGIFVLPPHEKEKSKHIAYIGKPHELTLKPKLTKECNSF
ncbi:hypothetical protein EV194_11064 [Natronoflexus pectinivorans]|uniref:Uncharacterized protein n=1 Tax=Natronoflexus pectinivorans TaxID=682526 RepID=A0A4R2GGB5_9BACT|nr:hypothetical protein EV194_11064 [Natronoflexus pectinivorans]